jgi:4-diphosphocytidyl-2C-methyl-D-erythritol kinase
VPEFGVSTKEAFQWWDQRKRPATSVGRPALRPPANDLQAVVAKRHPIVTTLVRTLTKHGAFHASLSGSGSAVFGLFRRRPAAQAAARSVAGPRTFVTPTLDRKSCRRLAAK